MSASGREEQLFEAARELKGPAERNAYLETACAGDPGLRRNVEALLAADAGAASFFVDGAAALNQSALDLATAEEPGDYIGPYKLLQKIGEGGCGVVFMAEQDQPIRRKVALKVIKLGMDTKSVIARFEAERQALALMDHPNIAKVFDAGATATGRPYFVMELVRGVRITEYCDQHKLSTHARLDLFAQVCHAIQHAHQKGIIHRDIKPSNILVTLHDGVPVPKVIDFGIAKATTDQRLTDKTLFTAFEQFMGTPAYMSPEQAEMSGLDIDTRSDIYSLGVLLYELLTGKTPFDGKELLAVGLDAMRRTIREKEPVRPSTRLATLGADQLTSTAESRSADISKLMHQLKGDLDWIVMKCLEKDRRRRYETANGLASDLKRHLNNEPVVARPPSTAYQFQKFLRRNKVISTATALVLTVILVGTGISITQTLRAQRELRRALAAESEAQREKANAQAAERDSRQQLYAALFEQARATVRSGEMGHRVKALDALRRAAAISNNVELRREAFAALVLPDLRFERDVSIGQNVTQARCDPAFERIALCRGPRDVEVRSLDSGRLLASLPASTNLPAYGAMWSDDGRYLMVKRDHSPAVRSDWEVWDVTAQRRLMLIRHLRGDSIAFHPHSNLVVTAHSKAISLWHLESGHEVGRYSIMHEPRRLEISSNGKRFALVHAEPKCEIVSIFETDRGAVTASWKFSDLVGDLRWHPSGQWLAVADYSGKVQLLDVETGNATVLGRHKAEATTLTFSPGGEYLISGGWEREMVCWDLQTHQRAFTVGINSHHLQFSANGRRCATLVRSPLPPGYFLELKLHAFELPAGHREFLEDLGNRMEQAAFSPDGRWLAAAGQKRLGLWSLTTKDPGRVIEAPPMARLDFTRDGAGLFGSGLGGECLQWRISAGGEPAVPQLQPLPVRETKGFNSVCVVSNRVIWTGPKGSRIQSLDGAAADTPLIQTSSGLNGVSPDGQWLGIYRLNSRLLQIYQLPAFEPLAGLTNRAIILGFMFSPQGNELAVSTRSGVQFWSTKTWTRTRELADFRGILYGSDGRALWLTKDYRTAGLFDARTLKPLLPLPASMLPLALSSDGRFLAVNVDSRKLQVWDVTEVRRQLGSLGLDWVD